jgi:hypothetical protein
MDMSGAVAALATGTYVVTRFSAGTTTNGIYSPGGSSTFNVIASVQPAAPEVLDRMPEGTRLNDLKTVFATVLLLTGDENQGLKADRIAIDGNDYEVISKRDWQGFGSFTQAVVQRVDPT